MAPPPKSALVLFSGGQDSAVCLAWALGCCGRVETVGFDYGQRHASEMDARPRVLDLLREKFPDWRDKMGADHVLSLDVLKQIGGSALTDAMTIEMGANGLPTTFVPGRNILFLTAAAALAYRRGSRQLVGGMCETDYSGYPDCRPAFIEAFRQVAATGQKRGIEGDAIEIRTPLIESTKPEIVRMGLALDAPLELTWSCYRGSDKPCGSCDACLLRARGFAGAGVDDPSLR